MAQGLKDKLQDFFPVGVAIHSSDISPFLLDHFNRITCQDDMKMKYIHPELERYDFTEADKIAEFASKHSLPMCGHTLLDTLGVPSWIRGRSEAELKDIIKEHITTVMARYDSVVDHWEVANEFVSDLVPEFYRRIEEGNLWREVISDSYEIVKWAFKCAMECRLKLNSPVQLYYGEHSLPHKAKREKTIWLIRKLRSEGIQVEGINFQAHWTARWPGPYSMRDALNEFMQEDVPVRIGEFDISIYTTDDWARKIWAPTLKFTPEMEEAQAIRCKEAFDIFKEFRPKSLTVWGVNDETSWLNNFPLKRPNNPLFFTGFRPKKMYDIL